MKIGLMANSARNASGTKRQAYNAPEGGKFAAGCDYGRVIRLLLDSGVTKFPALQHKLVILVVHCSMP
jgi:hypothetical protein